MPRISTDEGLWKNDELGSFLVGLICQLAHFLQRRLQIIGNRGSLYGSHAYDSLRLWFCVRHRSVAGSKSVCKGDGVKLIRSCFGGPIPTWRVHFVKQPRNDFFDVLYIPLHPPSTKTAVKERLSRDSLTSKIGFDHAGCRIRFIWQVLDVISLCPPLGHSFGVTRLFDYQSPFHSWGNVQGVHCWVMESRWSYAQDHEQGR